MFIQYSEECFSNISFKASAANQLINFSPSDWRIPLFKSRKSEYNISVRDRTLS